MQFGGVPSGMTPEIPGCCSSRGFFIGKKSFKQKQHLCLITYIYAGIDVNKNYLFYGKKTYTLANIEHIKSKCGDIYDPWGKNTIFKEKE